MENIFIQRNSVITSFIVPWILGFGCKTSEEAKQYIKYGETLSPGYYPPKEDINKNFTQVVYLKFMERLFNDNNIDYELTQIIILISISKSDSQFRFELVINYAST